MVVKSFFVIFLLFLFTNQCFAQLSGFFQSVPPPDAFIEAEALKFLTEESNRAKFSEFMMFNMEDSIAQNNIASLHAEAEIGSVNLLRPVITLPAIKITESVRTDAKVDAQFLTSVGGGISYQHLCWNSNKNDGAWVSTWSISALVLISGDTDSEGVHLDISPALSFGFLNDVFMIGGGYDLGVVENRSRWFLLLSTGLNFNN